LLSDEDNGSTKYTFKDGVALCQLIRGAITIQMAAFVKLTTRGIPGAVLAFLGFGFSALIFMTVLTDLYMLFI
jgi:chromate transporter